METKKLCVQVENQPFYSYLIGIILMIGITGSYLPQFITLYRRKTTIGMSYLSIFLVNLSCFLVFFAGILDDWSTMQCCYTLSFWGCSTVLLPIFQLGISWGNVMVLYLIMLYYYPSLSDKIKRRWNYFLFIIYLILICTFFGVGYHMIDKTYITSHIRDYTDTLGILAAVANIIYLSPQIWQTYQLKDPGSLSLWTLGLQLPGIALVVIFQGMIYHQDWPVWVPYIVSGLQQGWLLGMCLYYLDHKRKLLREIGIINTINGSLEEGYNEINHPLIYPGSVEDSPGPGYNHP